MPFAEPHQAYCRDSWPPTILRLKEADLSGLNEIDLNPISYFLTTPEVFEDDVEDLSAGIESDDDIFPEIRDVSPSSLQRAALDSEGDSSMEEDPSQGLTGFLSLRDFDEAHMADANDDECYKDYSTIDTDVPPLPVRSSRRSAKLMSTNPLRGRGRTRSPSGQRQHSWLEPSPDVWTIPEEKEDAEDTVVQGATPAPEWEKYQGNLEGTLIETDNSLLPRKKPKKKVRWAFDLESRF